MDDLHGAAAKHIGRPDQQREGQRVGCREGFFRARGDRVLRLPQAEFVDEALEAPAVLGKVDRIGRGAENRNFGGFKRPCQLERRLTAELHDDALQRAAGLLDAAQFDHVLGRQRLEVEPIGCVVVGRYRFRIAIDHDRFIAVFALVAESPS